MRKGFGIVAAAGMLAGLTAALADDAQVRRWVHGHVAPAQMAYRVLEQDPGAQRNFERAARLIQRARQREPRDAWVFIALAKASLANGYQEGSRFDAAAFAPGSVERARAFAERALERGPHEGLAHALVGRIALIEGRPRAARRALDRAERLAPNSFQPYLFRSVLHRRTGEYARARDALAAAERRRRHSHHGRWLREARSDLTAAVREHSEPPAIRKGGLQEIDYTVSD